MTERNKKRNAVTFYIVLTALFCALTFVATLFFNIPAAFILGAGGNINLGDTVIFIAGFVLGPIGGAAAGALGASMADIMGGYIMYAPFTAAIKGLEGCLCGLIFKILHKNRRPVFSKTVATFIGSFIVIIGYFFTEVVLLKIAGASGTTLWLAGARTLLPNLIQTLLSAILALTVSLKIPSFITKS